MQTTIRWVGPVPENLKAHAFKKNAPKGAFLLPINFGLYGHAYVETGEQTRHLLTKTGGEVPVFEFRLVTGGHVIGLRDTTAAQHLPFAEEWRQACIAKQRWLCGLPEVSEG